MKIRYFISFICHNGVSQSYGNSMFETTIVLYEQGDLEAITKALEKELGVDGLIILNIVKLN